MDMSLETAELVSWLSNWTLVAALLIGVAATYFIVVSGNIKEAALKETVADSNKTTEASMKRPPSLM
jgi:hypothetical protein